MTQRQSQLKETEQTTESNIEEQLHGYKFIKTLGKGNFGKVKLAVHILTGEYVAIKILEKDLIFEKADIQRISRQIKIMKQARHPYIIQLYQIIQNTKRLYLIMEYGEGGDLFDLIVKKQRIQQKSAASIFAQIILGLQYLHSKGISHRDMKPENILLSNQNVIKIADFGLGNFFKKDELLKTACGSPCYASPEMLSRVPYNPETIDVWSSGIILYAMVCGYLPFEDDNTAKLYEKIKNTNPRLPRALSEDLKILLRQILDKNPQKRIKISQIKKSVWLQNQFSKISNTQFSVQMNKVKKICEIYNIEDQQKLINYLKKNKHNTQTTIYYLASKKIQLFQEQTKSEDSQQQQFNQNQSQDIAVNVEQCNVEKIQDNQQEIIKQNTIQQQDAKNSNYSNKTHQISFSQLNRVPQNHQNLIENHSQMKQPQKQMQNKQVEEIRDQDDKKQNQVMEIKQQKQMPNIIEGQNIFKKRKQSEDQFKQNTIKKTNDDKKSEKQQQFSVQMQQSWPSINSDCLAQESKILISKQQQSQNKDKDKQQESELVKKQNIIINKQKYKDSQHSKTQQQMDISQKQDKEQSFKSTPTLNIKNPYSNNNKNAIQHQVISKPQPQINNSVHSTENNNFTKNKLKKVDRMPIQKHTISRKNTITHPRQKPINQKSHSKDPRATHISSRKLIGKTMIRQPHLIDPDKIVFCSWNRLVNLLSELGVQGKVQYYPYTKQCIYLSKCHIKGIRNFQQIIEKINMSINP